MRCGAALLQQCEHEADHPLLHRLHLFHDGPPAMDGLGNSVISTHIILHIIFVSYLYHIHIHIIYIIFLTEVGMI